MKNRQVAVLGLGRFGQSIVRTLSQRGCSVLACDVDHDKVQDVSEYATHVVQADLTDESAVSALGLSNFDVVVVAIGTNKDAGIMTTLLAKEAGAKYVIAKASNMKHKTILEKIGADRVVLPEMEMGVRIALNLLTTNVVDLVSISEDLSIADIEPLDSWIGNTLQKTNIRADFGLNVVAIRRNKKTIVSPKPTETFQADDVLVVIGEVNDLQRFITKNRVKSGGFFD